MVKWGVIPCSELETIKQTGPFAGQFSKTKDCPLSFTVHGPLCLILQINIVIEKNLAMMDYWNFGKPSHIWFWIELNKYILY
jgi:hypothetical protein